MKISMIIEQIQKKPRHTITYYYYVKTNELINENNLSLTESEITENFKVQFVSKEELIKILNENHENATNGIYFDEEIQIILNNFFK